ncbi:YqhG family protein [Paenibacillus sp. GCM10027626]|uniref:YqhG family protein n=1 Tax=Paenibacillus sp. GCM10027626 TaxID=3273411 RepID=UPI00362AD58E
MNERQVHKFVQRYLETTNCQILEKSPCHFHVKLSPQADRDLTNRPFYWSFVDRTGADPETMSMLLVTDKRKYEETAAKTQPVPDQASQMNAAANAALGRSLGYVHGALNHSVRIPREDVYYGSKKLEQLFQSAKAAGSYVCLFQEPDQKKAHPLHSTAYTAWLGITFKVEFACDMKREEIHSIGVSLATGQCLERFNDTLLALKMTPRLPPNVHTAKNGLSFTKATSIAEQAIERKLKTYDYGWADEAAARLQQELQTIAHYYEPMIQAAEPERVQEITDQFGRRQEEIRWQYEPRVTLSAINCGIFYLQGIG